MSESILSTAELEHIIQHFKPHDLHEVGSIEWFMSIDKICKLYQVAVLEIRTEGPERIKSALSVDNRIGDFTKDLVTIGLWKEKVLPLLLKFKPEPTHSFPVYIVLYCEVMLAGLLEALLFHSEMFWDLGDLCFDLIDFTVERLSTLSTKGALDEDQFLKEDRNPLKEIEQSKFKMNLTVSSSCITILRYVTENFDKMPLSAASRLYSQYDLPLVVASIIDNSLWSQKKDGKMYKFENNNWREWHPDDPILSYLECQTWLLLRQLLLNSTSDTVYYYNEHRKEHLSKLTRYLYDSVVDYLSPLADLKIWLHRLSINSYKQDTTSNPLIMEINESFRDKLLIKYDGKWEDLALKSGQLLLYPKESDVKILAQSLSKSIDGMVLLDENIHSCFFCYAKAMKRCSKCQKAWYCSRKCQVEHWKSHKNVCN